MLVCEHPRVELHSEQITPLEEMHIYLPQPEPFLICKKYGHISLSGESEIVNCSNHYFVKCTLKSVLY